MRQVVSNLVENAAKFTEPGGTITVTLEQRGDDAVLAVRDSGIGIAAENLERIFEPFMQSHRPLVRPSSGLGIGLSVVRRVMELHSGDVKVISGGLSAGSEFVVSLPLASADTREGREAEKAETRAPAPSVTPRTRKVMIVDDHEEVRISLSRLARGWGHEVAVAGDGASALALAETFQPECAIVDLSMPDMNGIDLARELRQRFPPAQLYLIALTGYAGTDIRDACLDAGFDAHVVKPGEIDRLEQLLGGDVARFMKTTALALAAAFADCRRPDACPAARRGWRRATRGTTGTSPSAADARPADAGVRRGDGAAGRRGSAI